MKPLAALAVVGVMLTPSLAAPAPAAGLSAADRAWIATCVAQLADEPAPNKSVKERYCLCMHEPFDDNRPVTQTEMEHMFPPLHRACNRQSGWK